MKILMVLLVLFYTCLPVGAVQPTTVTPFHFAFGADSRDDYSVLPVLTAKAATLNPVFFVFAGDLCGSFSTTCINNQWKVADKLLAVTFATRGNHDAGSVTTWASLWNFPSIATTIGAVNYTAQVTNATYSFDYSNSHFAFIDLPSGGINSWTATQITWLDNDLTAAEGRDMVHEFVFAHSPVYGVTSQHGGEKPSAAMKTIINKHPITAWFAGHEHITTYTHVTTARVSGVNSLEQFVIGRTGAPAYNVTKPVDFNGNTNAFADIFVNGNDVTVTIYSQASSAIFTKTFTSSTSMHPLVTGNVGTNGATLSYTDGTQKNTLADGSGNYSFPVSYNWSGVVTPSKAGYFFLPNHKTYSNVVANQTGQNYTAIAITNTLFLPYIQR